MLRSILQPAAEALTFLEASATECQLELSCNSLRCFPFFLLTFASCCLSWWQVWMSTAQLLLSLFSSSSRFQVFSQLSVQFVVGNFLSPLFWHSFWTVFSAVWLTMGKFPSKIWWSRAGTELMCVCVYLCYSSLVGGHTALWDPSWYHLLRHSCSHCITC